MAAPLDQLHVRVQHFQDDGRTPAPAARYREIFSDFGAGQRLLLLPHYVPERSLLRHTDLLAGQHRQDRVPRHVVVYEGDGRNVLETEQEFLQLVAFAERFGRRGPAVRVEVEDDLPNAAIRALAVAV